MSAVLAEHELFDSCRVLFGSELQITRAFLEYLQRPGIKSAYRQRALTTHPDILARQGESAVGLGADLFRGVQQAYEHLTTYVDARENGFRFPRPLPVRARQAAPVKPAAPATPRPQARGWSASDAAAQQARPKQPRHFSRPTAAWPKSSPDWRAAAKIPARKLLFGHFLLYAGVTNWPTIIKALVWQRTGRPRLGEIGRRFGWLTEQNILHILKRRKLSESFGSSAISLGLLTDQQLRLMIFQQNRLQKKFGEYFIHHQLLSPAQVNELARQFARHNHSYAPPPAAYAARM